MKKFLSVLLAVFMVVGLVPVTVFAEEADVTEIGTVEELIAFAEAVNAGDNFEGKTVVLTADISFDEDDYWYYNDGTTVVDYIIDSFAGTFDGQGYSIVGMKYFTTVKPSTTWGLFGAVEAEGTVKNLTLDTITAEVNFSADTLWRGNIGFIAYSMRGTAENCHVNDVTVTTNRYAALREGGAMFGGVSGTATNCTATDIDINDNYDGVNGGYWNLEDFGGFAAVVTGKLDGCMVDGVNIIMSNTGYTKKVGGMIGRTHSGSVVIDCSAKNVTITANGMLYITGGFVGHAEKNQDALCTFTNCSVENVTINTTGISKQVGGFVGEAKGSSFDNCDVAGVTMNIGYEGSQKQHSSTAGFAGQTNGEGATFSGCDVTGLEMNIEGKLETSVGGFVTALGGAGNTFDNCSAEGTIDATIANEGRPVGGFLGDLGWNAGNGTITGCTADVDITSNGPVGGFIAQSSKYTGIAGTNSLTVTDSTATGNVTSTSGAAGGFVAEGDRGTYSNCTATGDVSGNTAAGFWGEITPNNTEGVPETIITITNSSAEGRVNGDTVASGFIGTAAVAEGSTVEIKNNVAASSVTSANGEVVDFVKEIDPESGDPVEDGNIVLEGNVRPEEETIKFNPFLIPGFIDFETNGGTEIERIVFIFGARVKLAKFVPEKEGYTFTGWYADEELTEKIESARLRRRGTTVYAGWEENK